MTLLLRWHMKPSLDDTELNENVKPFVYKCREHVLQIAGSDSAFRRDDYKELQSSALSFLMVKKEKINSD